MQAVALTTAKLPKLGWVNFWPSSSKLSLSAYPEILIVYGTRMPLQGPIEVFALTRDRIFSSVRPTHGVRCP